MFELISLISAVLAISALASARGARARLDTELAQLKLELKRLAEQGVGPAAPRTAAEALPVADATETAPVEELAPVAAVAEVPEQAATEAIQPVEEPVTAAAPVDYVVEQPKIDATPKESFESRLAARWTVWVGGLALAFAGIFAVKYSIDQGLLDPAVRLTLAAIFGLVLVGTGEWLRRRTEPLVQNQFNNAMIPGILTAAGTITLFGSIFVAHGFYGYIGTTTAFLLLALVSIATLGLSMLHGQALAGLGLLGSFVTPALVSSTNPSIWGLFGYLSLVWVATTVASRIQRWNIVQALGNIGLGVWVLLYLSSGTVDVPVLIWPPLLSILLMIAGLAFIWPGRGIERPVSESENAEEAKLNAWTRLFFPAHIGATLTAALVGLGVAMTYNSPDIMAPAETWIGFAGTVLALALFGAYRRYAVYPAILSALSAFAGIRLLTQFASSSGFQPADAFAYADPLIVIRLALGLGLSFALLSLVVTHFRREAHPQFTRLWLILGTVTPLALGAVSFFYFGNYSFDPTHGLYALILAVLFFAGAWRFFGQADEPLSFHIDRALLVGASWAALVFALLALTDDIMTTLGVAIVGFAYLNLRRVRDWTVLPWVMVASALFVAGRIAWDPTIVGPLHLSTTPVFNQLLIGYGVPTLLLIASAWLIRDVTEPRIRNVMDALAALFALLTLAILVRHAMNNGTLNSDAPTLAEQSIYTLLTVGASVVLMMLDLRRPSIIFRTGSMAIGYISMASVAIAHFAVLNPYFSNELTGSIPFFNLLFLGYLLPAVAYAGAALVARGRRPQHYVIALALVSAALAFAYVTLSVRRIYQGADISDWKGFMQAELYTYSVVWLVLGVVLLVVGSRLRSKALRIASAVLVLIAVLKVFLIDMSNLEGLYRALSFFGLGVALIGIGRFYQTVLTNMNREDAASAPVVPEEPAPSAEAPSGQA